MASAEQIWRSKTDTEVFLAVRALGDYTPDGQRIILAELARRQAPEYQEAQRAAIDAADADERRRSATPAAAARRRWRLYAFVLAIPTVGVVVSALLTRQLTELVRDAWRQQMPLQANLIDRLNLSAACGLANMGEPCDALRSIEWLRVASLVTAAVGLGLVFGIRWAGRAAARDRRTLLALFGPGFKSAAVLVAVLVIADAGIINGAMWTAVSLIGRSGGGPLSPAIALAALLSAGRVLFVAFTQPPPRTPVVGTLVSRDANPEMSAEVGDLARRLGAELPDQIVVGVQPTFFVTEIDVQIDETVFSGRTLYGSLPLMRLLSRGEFRAVLAHELAHFAAADTAFSRRFVPTFQSARAALGTLLKPRNWLYAMVGAPAALVLANFLETFGTAERAFSRQRELEADARAAGLEGAEVMATALLKTETFGPVIQRLRVPLPQRASADDGPNLSEALASAAAGRAQTIAIAAAEDSHDVHPTDTHPPTAVRLASLSVTRSALERSVRQVAPQPPAIALLRSYERYEELLTAHYLRGAMRVSAVAAGAQAASGAGLPAS